LQSDAILGVLFAVLAAVGFSAKAIFIKLAYLEQVDAITLLALRMALALPFFIGMALWVHFKHPDARPLERREWLLVCGLGLVGYYLSSLFDFLGLQFISAGLERLILFLYPTFTVVLVALLERKAIERKIIAAMLLSYAGIALVFLHDFAGMEQSAGITWGALLVLMSALCYSTYLVGAGHTIARIGAMRFTAYAMIVSSAASLLQFFATRSVSLLDLPLRVHEMGLALAIISTVLPVLLLSYAIHRIGSGLSSMIGAIGPVSTIFLAYVFLHEKVSALQMAGSALVLCGVLIVSLSARKRGGN
jgi:drug/metabolite transporter (DMT)-like permease